MRLLVTITALMLVSACSSAAAEIDLRGPSCDGPSIGNFESLFPSTVKRLVVNTAMLGPFVELWEAGSRPALSRHPEHVIIYAMPDLPLIVVYEEARCIIAYLTIDITFLWQWLRPRIGWQV